MKKAICLLVLLSATCSAQDPYFVNNQRALVHMNPSFAGSNGGTRLQMLQRTVPMVNFNSGYIGVDTYIKPLKGGLSVSWLTDNGRNTTKTNCFSLAYAQYMKLGLVDFIPSVQIGYMYRFVEPHYLFSDMGPPKTYLDWRYDQLLTKYSPSASYHTDNYDASAGVLFRFENLYLGSSLMHINRPDIGYESRLRMPMQFNAHASYNARISHGSELNFSGRFTTQDKKNCGQVLVNGVFMRHLVLGAGVTAALFDNGGPAAVINMGYRNNWTSLLVAYNGGNTDYTLSAWEATLGFSIRKKDPEGVVSHFEKW